MKVIAQLITLPKFWPSTSTKETDVADLYADLHNTQAPDLTPPTSVILNETSGERSEDIWISSVNGDLSIKNIQINDAAMYRCNRHGSISEPIELQIGNVLVFGDWHITRLSCILKWN